MWWPSSFANFGPDIAVGTGDVRTMLAAIPDGTVHCCVTSPPYWGLRDYGVEGQIGMEPTPEAFVETMVEVFRDVRRVLHPSGTLWLNLGDSYAGSWGNYGGQNRGNGTQRPIVSGSQVANPAYEGLEQMRPPTTNPPGLKPKDLCMIPWRVALALQADGWWIRSVICWHKKCLSGGTFLYARTQNGEGPVMLKDLARLKPSTVQLWNGKKWTQVVGWSKREPDKEARRKHKSARHASYRGTVAEGRNGAELEIELRTGERIGCTRDHRWPTQRGLVFASDLQVGDVLQSTRTPEPESPLRPRLLDDAEIGWLCGFYLAEGCGNGKAMTFAMHADEKEYFERIKTLAESFGGTARLQRGKGKAAQSQVWCGALREICKRYIAGTSCYNKHLSAACWQRSNAFLSSLLQGYLDGDGHKRKDTAEWRVGFCNNDALANDLRAVCARLGASLHLRRVKHTCGDKRFPGWRGSIRFGNDRKQPDTQIIAIRPSRARQYWDIEVADDPHLFATASGVLTHNSCMPESVTDRPTNSWEPIFLLAKRSSYFYDAEAVKEQSVDPEGSAERYKHEFHVGAKESAGGCRPGNAANTPGLKTFNGTRNQRNVWSLGPEPYSEAHFATFPTEIPRRAILAGTSARGCCPKCYAPWVRVVENTKYEPPVVAVGVRNVDDSRGDKTRKLSGADYNDQAKTRTIGWRAGCTCGERPIPCVVLDPFAGAGTSLLVAHELRRRSLGIELNPDYVGLIGKRLDPAIRDRASELPFPDDYGDCLDDETNPVA